MQMHDARTPGLGIHAALMKQLTRVLPVFFLAIACSKSAPAPMEECSGNSMCRGQPVQVCCTGDENCVVRTAGQADRSCMGGAASCTQVLTDLLTSCEMTMADAGQVTHDDAMEVDLGQEMPDAGEAPDVDMTPDAMESPDVDMTPDAMDMTPDAEEPDAGAMTACEALAADCCPQLPMRDRAGCEATANAGISMACQILRNDCNRLVANPGVDRDPTCMLGAVGAMCNSGVNDCCTRLCGGFGTNDVCACVPDGVTCGGDIECCAGLTCKLPSGGTLRTCTP